MPNNKNSIKKYKEYWERSGALRERRNLKMAGSAQAYMRGNTQNFHECLSAASDGDIPEGPPVWICGDCHFGNLGPLADTDGRITIEIRDLDHTIIGNPAHPNARHLIKASPVRKRWDTMASSMGRPPGPAGLDSGP